MERLMQYVWQHRLWPQNHSFTVDGRRVQIIDPGRLNTDSGPDFFNAKLKIDGHLWAGDIEIHVRATDWHRHGHDKDRAYDSVILHVVDRDDTMIRRSNGELIPQMRMPCEPSFYKRYSDLVDRADRDLPCANLLSTISPLYLTDWMQSLAFERLYEKSERITDLVLRLGGDWDAAAYVTIARSLGFGINGEPFERLALSTPLRMLWRHADELFTIEAMLFGQSGLLPPQDSCSYADQLRREYDFFSHKFGIQPPQSLGWKMSRMRPANLPHRRIAILAAILHTNMRLLQQILQVNTADQAANLFSPELTGFWQSHYSFSPASTASAPKALSRSSIHSLIINVVVPLQHAYATTRGDEAMAQLAIDLLQSIPPEKNNIIDLFNRIGITAKDAFTTQALIQLRKSYCLQRKCLYCRIGHRHLAANVRRKD